MRNTLCSILLVMFCGYSFAGSGKDKELMRLATWMNGHFSSELQARSDSDYMDIRLHMIPVFGSRTDGFWFYVEQSVAGAEDRPYRQRFYRLHRNESGQLVSAVYTSKGSKGLIGVWKNPASVEAWPMDSLELRDGCSILLKSEGSRFKGGTWGTGCESKLRGASYATSEVVISRNMLLSWDRGFDASGKQVWGAEKGGYQFIKQKSIYEK